MITFRGVTIRQRGRLQGQDRGLFLEPSGLMGVFDGPELRRDMTGRLRHGSFPDDGTLADRVITARGVAIAETWTELQSYRDTLAALSLAGSDVLQVEVDDDTRWCEAFPHGSLKFAEIPGNTVARWQLQWWCPDPWLYGETRRFTGLSQPFHRGSVDAYPKVLFKGDFGAGFQLVVGGGGGTYTYLKPASGATLDVRSMALISSTGQWLTTLLGKPPVIPPFESSPRWWSVNAQGRSGVLQIDVTDTYI